MADGDRVVVTGGASFIGSHIVEHLLDRGHRVVVYDSFRFGPPITLEHLKGHARLEIVAGDVRDAASVSAAVQGAAAVIHLAAFLTKVIVEHPEEALDVNLAGAMTVLRRSAEAGVRHLVLGSSVSVYGLATGTVGEDQGFTPGSLHWGASLYGYGKLLTEQFGRMLADRRRVNVVALRYGTVYGRRQHWRGVDAPFFIRTYERLKRGLRPQVYGDGAEAHDYIDARDVARATLKAMAFEGGFDAVNVVTGRAVSLLEAQALIQEIAGTRLQVEHLDPPPGSRGITATNFSYDPRRVARVIGFRSEIPLAQGLRDLLAWWDSEGRGRYAEPTA